MAGLIGPQKLFHPIRGSSLGIQVAAIRGRATRISLGRGLCASCCSGSCCSLSMVGLWCSLWLPRVAMKQQVACTWGSNVPFCMSCLSYHLAWLYWLLLLGLPLLFRVSCWHSLTLPGIPAHWKLWFLPPDPSPPAVHKLGSQECRPSARNFFF